MQLYVTYYSVSGEGEGGGGGGRLRGKKTSYVVQQEDSGFEQIITFML